MKKKRSIEMAMSRTRSQNLQRQILSIQSPLGDTFEGFPRHTGRA